MHTIWRFFVLLILASCAGEKPAFRPGEVWNDTEGNPINAHGGGVMFHKGTYYWYGEIKNGETTLVEYTGWEAYRVEAGGVSCYSSQDLYNWKYEGVALAPEKTDTTSDIHPGKVIERPKVVYNEKTGKFVMWMHVDTEDYLFARAGVATSDKPEGPFTYLGSIRPQGQMSRDQTLFRDTDGKAYQICSSENNETMYINELSDDYLQPTGKYRRVFVGMSREAPAIVKHEGRYCILTSGCTGWDPNPASYAVSDSILGTYTVMGNPCRGVDADKTYYSQSTFILPVTGRENKYIALFDRWNKTNLPDSRYVWLPMHFTGDSMVVEWKTEWRLD